MDGEGLRVGVVAARYNFQLVNGLLESCLKSLISSGVREEDLSVVRVPGSNEIPQAVSAMARHDMCDVVIGLGLVIKGETDHAGIIGMSTAHELHRIASEEEIAVINGILTVNTEEQARERILGDAQRGCEFAHAALEMAQVIGQLEQMAMEEIGELTHEEEAFLHGLLGEDDEDDDFPRSRR